MKNYWFLFLGFMLILVNGACKKTGDPAASSGGETTGLKIAFVNGDSILQHFTEFRKESEVMEEKQRKAEAELQSKGAKLEKEFMDYQRKAQTGTMTGKDMQAREKYLSSRQEALLAERDQMARAIMEETEAINDRLKAVLQDKLNEIKEQEGYDFILSYVEGGAILAADEKYDITDRVLKELNAEEGARSGSADTTKKK